MRAEARERLIFFGTPEFAVPTLAALYSSSFRPVLVVTQPDRPRGRGRRHQAPPVGSWALERQLPVVQPGRVGSPDFLATVADFHPTTAVVVAFGQIFPLSLLDLVPAGCINVHASLLPKYRGAAPIQAAIIAGEQVTGITTMLMEEGLDSGPTLMQSELAIGPEETAGELSIRLADLGARVLLDTLELRARGGLEPQPQNHTQATFAPRLKREDGVIDWRVGAVAVFNRLRGLTPWPGVSTRWRDEPLKILWGRPDPRQTAGETPPGTFLGLVDQAIQIACGPGPTFAVERLQRPGRQAVTAPAFVHGARLEPGELFG